MANKSKKQSKAKSAAAIAADEPLSMDEALRLLNEAGSRDGNALDEAKRGSAATTKPSSDEYWKAILAAGGENGHESPDSSGGGIVICGTGPEPSTRKGRIKEFTRQLQLMARRAKKGDCYIVFEFQAERRKSDSQDRFLQFWFGSESFYADLPNTTFAAGEAESLVSSRTGFFMVAKRRVAEDQKDYVTEFNPVHRDYAYGDEEIAADDMAYILFDLWRLPVDVSVSVTAARA